MPLIKIFPSAEKAMETVPVGTMKRLLIGERKLTLAHTAQGWRAFDNLCPHQYEPLHKGMITPYLEVVCPLHHYRFDLTTGREASSRCDDLRLYKVIEKPDGLFVEI